MEDTLEQSKDLDGRLSALGEEEGILSRDYEEDWRMEYEPKIAAFCCTYCAYSAADLAGSMRLQYPPTVRMVKLLCTGKVEPIHLLKAFEAGADAVFVAG